MTDQEFIYAVSDFLCDGLEELTPEEIDQLLRDADLDPVALGEHYAKVAAEAWATSSLNPKAAQHGHEPDKGVLAESKTQGA